MTVCGCHPLFWAESSKDFLWELFMPVATSRGRGRTGFWCLPSPQQHWKKMPVTTTITLTLLFLCSLKQVWCVHNHIIYWKWLSINPHSSGSRKLSQPFICRWNSLIFSWPLPGFCVKQQRFLSVQQDFSALNLVLNTSQTKVMWFGKKNVPLPTGVTTTSEGLELEVVTSYKYLGVWLDGALSFSQHISKLQAKVKSRRGFLYRKLLLFHLSCQTNPDSDNHPTHARLRRHNL